MILLNFRTVLIKFFLFVATNNKSNFLNFSQGLNDCTCCICKGFNQETGNKLMECHTCQNLYHQECHTPQVSDQEAADPRLIWNCSNCSTPVQQMVIIIFSFFPLHYAKEAKVLFRKICLLLKN